MVNFIDQQAIYTDVFDDAHSFIIELNIITHKTIYTWLAINHDTMIEMMLPSGWFILYRRRFVRMLYISAPML